MPIGSIHDPTGKTAIEGASAEQRFENIARNRFPRARFVPATPEQDKFQHWDFALDQLKYEVKGMKRLSRRDMNVQDEWIPAEFKSVGGYPGWMYGGADKLAFETREGFIVVNRADFAKLAERLIDLTKMATRSEDAKYRGYTRMGIDGKPRGDLVGYLRKADVLSLPHEIWREGEKVEEPIRYLTNVKRGQTGPGGKQLWTTDVTVVKGKDILTKATLQGKWSPEQVEVEFKKNEKLFHSLPTPGGFKEWLQRNQ